MYLNAPFSPKAPNEPNSAVTGLAAGGWDDAIGLEARLGLQPVDQLERVGERQGRERVGGAAVEGDSAGRTVDDRGGRENDVRDRAGGFVVGFGGEDVLGG